MQQFIVVSVEISWWWIFKLVFFDIIYGEDGQNVTIFIEVVDLITGDYCKLWLYGGFKDDVIFSYRGAHLKFVMTCEDICTSSKSSIVIGAANFISDIGSDGVVRSTRELVVVPKNPAVSFPRIVNNHQGCRLYQFLLDTFLVCRSPYKWRGYQSRVGNFIATLCTATVTVGLLIFTGFSV